MVPPVAGLGPSADAIDERHRWLTPDRLTRVRAILLALSLLFGLAVYVFHTLGASLPRAAARHRQSCAASAC